MNRVQHRAASSVKLMASNDIRVAIIAMLIVIIAEVGLFNANHWNSLSYPQSTEVVPEFGSSLQVHDDGTVVLGEDSANNYLLLSDLNTHVGSVTLQLNKLDLDDSQVNEIAVQLVAQDAGNVNGVTLNATKVSTIGSGTSRIHVHLSGDSNWIKVMLLDAPETHVQIQRVAVNDRAPFHVSKFRVAAEIVVAALIVLFRPRSWVWKERWNATGARVRILLTGIGVVNLMVLVISMIPRQWWNPVNYSSLQWTLSIYQDQTLSFLDGHPWLMEQPPSELAAVPNPYDPTVFQQIPGALYDHAYYDGHYWSYYGLLPVMVFFLPIKVLTGYLAPTWICVFMSMALLIPASFWLIRGLLRRYASDASLGVEALSMLLFPVASLAAMLGADGRTYALPNAMGMLLVVCGFASWLSAMRDDGSLRTGWLACGSLAMGLTVGVRPSMALAAVLALPMFWPWLRRRIVKPVHWIAMLVPAVVAAVPWLAWNRIRFGSFLDFGEKYNLTAVDMAHQAGGVFRLPIAVADLLLQPIPMHFQWPFLFTNNSGDTLYQGQIASFGVNGGYFSFVPVVWCGLVGALILRSGSRRDDGPARMVMWSALGVCAALFVSDVIIGGINPRYSADWAWLMAMVTIYGLANIDSRMRDARTDVLSCYRTVLLVLALVSLALVYWSCLCSTEGVRASSLIFQWQLRNIVLPG